MASHEHLHPDRAYYMGRHPMRTPPRYRHADRYRPPYRDIMNSRRNIPTCWDCGLRGHTRRNCKTFEKAGSLLDVPEAPRREISLPKEPEPRCKIEQNRDIEPSREIPHRDAESQPRHNHSSTQSNDNIPEELHRGFQSYRETDQRRNAEAQSQNGSQRTGPSSHNQETTGQRSQSNISLKEDLMNLVRWGIADARAQDPGLAWTTETLLAFEETVIGLISDRIVASWIGRLADAAIVGVGSRTHGESLR